MFRCGAFLGFYLYGARRYQVNSRRPVRLAGRRRTSSDAGGVRAPGFCATDPADVFDHLPRSSVLCHRYPDRFTLTEIVYISPRLLSISPSSTTVFCYLRRNNGQFGGLQLANNVINLFLRGDQTGSSAVLHLRFLVQKRVACFLRNLPSWLAYKRKYLVFIAVRDTTQQAAALRLDIC